MKKLVTLLITLVILLGSLASCIPAKTEKINIGVMSGPTGMGMAKLMDDTSEDSARYSFQIFSDPTLGVQSLQAKTLDMLCLPTNTAANLAIKQSDFLSVISINCLGSLYLLTNEGTEINSIADLEGKTVYVSVPNSTTGPIVNYLLEQNGVSANIQTVSDHDTLVTMLSGNNPPEIVVLPEPKVSAALMKNTSYKVAINLSEAWDEVSDTPLTMGCIVVRNEFLSENKSAVDSFLRDYKASIEYIGNESNLDSAAQMIVDSGVLPALPVAKGALNNLYGSIVYIDGEQMKTALKEFYTAINCATPSDDFFYES